MKSALDDKQNGGFYPAAHRQTRKNNNQNRSLAHRNLRVPIPKFRELFERVPKEGQTEARGPHAAR